MKRQTFNVLAYVKKSRSLRNGYYPIYIRITLDGARSEFAANFSVNPECWDEANSCVISDNEEADTINAAITHIRLKLMDLKTKLELLGELQSPHQIRNKFLGVDVETKTVLQLFTEHNKNCEKLKGINFAPATVERYETCKKHLAEFIRERYKRPDFQLEEIKQSFITDFEVYLKTVKKCNHNTATKYIKNFKKIILIALNNGYMKANPFAHIRFHLKEVDIAYLTEEELQRLMALEISIPRLKRVRDIYVFSCFTGLAFSDTKELTYDNIEEIKGQKWIVTRRHKTKQLCRIPMLPPAISLMEQFKSDPYCMNSGRVLPVPSNQKMNAYLQELADLAGIKKHLSTHTARHTFATTVTLSNNISIEVVAKMLGHTSINMTKKYARVVDDYISKDMKKIENKYSM